MTGVGERLRLEREIGLLREGETKCIDPSSSNRKSVADTTKTPYKWICMLDTKTDKESYEEHGTGILISPRHVLTAAHTIYRKKAKYEKVAVRPGAHAAWSGTPYQAQHRYILRPYRKALDDPNDIGVIELSKDVAFAKSKSGLNQSYYGDPGPRALAYAMGLYPPANIVGLPDLSDLDMTNKNVTSIGYPGDKSGSFDSMYEFDGVIRTFSRKELVARMEMDTCTGQSGSPVFLFHDKDNYLIGVIVSINLTTSLAKVALLTPNRVTSLFGSLINPWFTGPLPARTNPMQERTGFEREISTLLGGSARPGPARQYDISAQVSHAQTIGFEFDVHYGFIEEVLDNAGIASPADGAVVTTHTWATDFFKVKRDGPRLEISTKPFTTDKTGADEIAKCLKGIDAFAKKLILGCSPAKEKSIAVAGVTGKPRPFPLPFGLAPVPPIVKLPFGGKFDRDCRVWASPQATLTLPIWKVGALVTAIDKSKDKGVGVALTGNKNHRMGVQSLALYKAQSAVTAMKKQLIQDGLLVKALGNKAFDDKTFSDRLSGFLILLASYLITSELPYRFDAAAPKKLRDYEPFAKAYLPLNVKAPFPDIFAELLFPKDQSIFKEVFAEGAARTRLFSLALPGATVGDGARKLFPTGPKEGSDDSVHVRQAAEFGSTPTWDDLVEHTLNASHKSWGSRLLVPISNQIPLDKTRPLFAVELRRIGFASVFANQWPGLVAGILKMAKKLI